MQSESWFSSSMPHGFGQPATAGATALAATPGQDAITDGFEAVRAQLLEPAGLDLNDIDRALGTLMSRKLDYADIYFQYTRFESWTVEDGIVKDGVHSVDHGVGVRALRRAGPAGAGGPHRQVGPAVVSGGVQ